MSDLIERKSIRNMYSCLNPNDRVLVGQVLIDINAIPSAEPSWADALAELHERFDALEKEIRKASAEMSAIIREYVDKDINVRSKDEPQTEVYKCPKCGKDTPIEFDECVWCLSPKDEPQTEVNCDRCKHKGVYSYCHYCDGSGESFEPQTEREGER